MNNDIARAYMVAEKAHANQSYDIYPYMYHIREVVKYAEQLGCNDTIKIACILHDVLEDSSLSYNDIRLAFGVDVAEIVYCVTDEMGRNRKERKEKTYPKLRENHLAIIVKIFDRVANALHSEKYNPKLYEMYKKEYKEFKDQLYYPHEDVVLKDAWVLLDLIFMK